MKNKLTDLNNHLFEQLERLNDDELVGEKLETEIERSKNMVSIGRTIIDNGKLLLDAQKTQLDYGRTTFNSIVLLGQQEEEKTK